MAFQEVEELKQGLVKDIAEAQAGLSESAAARGIKQPQGSLSDFSPRALIIQNKAVGGAELEGLNRNLKKVTQQLLFETGLTDDLERSKFERMFEQKLRQAQMQILDAAGKARVAMEERGLDQAQQQAIIAAFGGLAKGVGAGIVSNLGRGAQPSADGATTGPWTREPSVGPTLGVNTSLPSPNVTVPSSKPVFDPNYQRGFTNPLGGKSALGYE